MNECIYESEIERTAGDVIHRTLHSWQSMKNELLLSEEQEKPKDGRSREGWWGGQGGRELGLVRSSNGFSRARACDNDDDILRLSRTGTVRRYVEWAPAWHRARRHGRRLVDKCRSDALLRAVSARPSAVRRCMPAERTDGADGRRFDHDSGRCCACSLCSFRCRSLSI